MRSIASSALMRAPLFAVERIRLGTLVGLHFNADDVAETEPAIHLSNLERCRFNFFYLSYSGYLSNFAVLPIVDGCAGNSNGLFPRVGNCDGIARTQVNF